jgi:uncharacterized protein YndB with AHSA1/START domain
MTEQATTAAVRRSVTVPLTRERAFELFVDEFGAWWPKDSHHIGEVALADAIIEPRVGGRWYERDEDGGECEWGRVLVIERPARILLAWQLSPRFTYDPDPARATEVEVTFEPDAGGATTVTLEHRGFEVHGDAAGAMRDSIAGEGGWTELLAIYAKSSKTRGGAV